MTISAFQRFITRGINYLLFFAGFFACVPVLRFAGYSVYLCIMGVLVLLSVLTGKFSFKLNPLSPFLICTIITYILVDSNLPTSYHQNNFNGLISILTIYIVSASFVTNSTQASFVVKGVIFSGKINVIWILLQTILDNFFKFDINKFLFTDLLHMVENASQIKYTNLVPTGLCWNAGGIAAAILLLVALVSGPWRVLGVIAGIATQSTTILVGLTLILIYLLVSYVRQHGFNMKITPLYFIIGAFVFCIFILSVAFIPQLQATLNKILSITVNRATKLISGASSFDSSANAHFDYYNNLPSLTERMGSKQLLFGYGIDCSGFPYTQLTKQYFWLDSWFLESDFTNTYLSMGIFGIISMYFFLIFIIIKQWNNYRIISVIMIIFIICGYFYNIQSVTYYWLLFLEFALMRSSVAKPLIN